MPIEFNCHVCGKLLRTSDEKAGRIAKCPGCGENLTVPHSEAEAEEGFGRLESGGGDADHYDDDFVPMPAGGETRACPMCGESISRQSTRCEFCGEQMGRGRHSGVVVDKVAAPAIGLMVVAGLGIAVQLLSVAVNLLTMLGVAQPGFQQGQQPFGAVMSGGVGLVFNAIGISVGSVIILGALKMRRLESFGMAMTASIIVMVPCLSPCCLVGLPIGIWSLVVLNDSEVKAAFPR